MVCSMGGAPLSVPGRQCGGVVCKAPFLLYLCSTVWEGVLILLLCMVGGGECFWGAWSSCVRGMVVLCVGHGRVVCPVGVLPWWGFPTKSFLHTLSVDEVSVDEAAV